MNSPRKWAEEEEERLLAMKAAGEHVAVIARELHRTEVAVTLRASQLRKRKSRTEVEVD